MLKLFKFMEPVNYSVKTLNWIFFSLLGISFFNKMLYVFNIPIPPTDYIAMEELGYNLLHGYGYESPKTGTGFNLLRSPLYPAILGFISLITNDVFLWAKIFNSVVTTLIPLLLFVSLKDKVNIFVLFASSSVLLFHPHLFFLSGSALGEAVFSFLLCLLFLLSLKNTSLGFNETILSGFLIGLLYFARPEAVFLLLLYIVIIIFLKQSSLKKKILHAFLLVVFVLITVSPYIMFIKSKTGEFKISGKSNLVYSQSKSFVSDKYSWEETEKNKSTLFSDIISDPFMVVKIVSYHGARTLNFLLKENGAGYIFIIILLLLILTKLTKEKPKINIRFLATTVIFLLLIFVYFIFHAEERYLYSYSFLVICLIMSLFNSNSRTTDITAVLLLLVIPVFLLFNIKLTASHFNYDYIKDNYPVEHRDAGLWLKENHILPASLRISSRKSFVIYYCDAWQVKLPSVDTKIPDIKRFFAENEVDYIIADKRFMFQLRNNLKFLMSPKEAEKYGFISVKIFNEGKENELIIYKIL